MNMISGGQFAGYEIVRQLGSGGSKAKVYQAVNSKTGEMVALKMLNPDSAVSSELVDRFRREIKLLGKLNHPHIIRFVEGGNHNGILFIATEYMEFGDLSEVMQAGRLTLTRQVQVVRQIAEALDFAHQSHIIHRDVKPGNILVKNENHVVLSDFGIASIRTEATLHDTATWIGTPEYLAPEQIQGNALDGRTDIYALSMVAYRLLTGDTPFPVAKPDDYYLAHLTRKPYRPSLKNTDLPASVDAVLLRGLEKEPVQRYQTATQFAAALETAMLSPSMLPVVRTLFTRVAPTSLIDSGISPLPIYAAISGLIIIIMGLVLVSIAATGNTMPISPTAMGSLPTQMVLPTFAATDSLAAPASSVPAAEATHTPLPPLPTDTPAASFTPAPQPTITPTYEGNAIILPGATTYLYFGASRGFDHGRALDENERLFVLGRTGTSDFYFVENLYHEEGWIPADTIDIHTTPENIPVMWLEPPPAGLLRGLFAYVWNQGSTNPNHYLIVLQNADNQLTRTIATTDTAMYSRMRWSPDGRYLSYEERQGETITVYLYDINTQQNRVIGTDIPVWSSNSQFFAVKHGDSYDVTDVRSGQTSSFIMPFPVLTLAFTGDGRNLMVVTGDAFQYPETVHKIYRVSTDGSNSVQIGSDITGGHDFVFSPDVTRLAYSRSEALNNASDIMVLDIANQTSRSITDTGIYDYHDTPAWSPDGSRIAFRAYNAAGSGLDFGIVNSDGTNLRILSRNSALAGCGWGAQWSPFGDWLVVQCSSQPGVHISNLDGSRMYTLVDDAGPDYYGFPVWGAGHL